MTSHKKTFIIRVDLNLPYSNGVFDTTRLLSCKDGINKFLKKGKVVLISHFGRPNGNINVKYSLDKILPIISEMFNTKVHFAEKIESHEIREKTLEKCNIGEIILLENLRFYKGEEDNYELFAEEISKWGDFYINDAFSIIHRDHASTSAIKKFIPSFIGPTLSGELEKLEFFLNKPKKPILGIIGGSKISSKIGVLNSLVEKFDHLFIGGAMANTFLKSKGYEIGKSLFEDEFVNVAKKINEKALENNCKIHLPIDVCGNYNDEKLFSCLIEEVKDDYIIYDIGNKTIDMLGNLFEECETILWNGPVGYFENDDFSNGSIEIAKMMKNATIKFNKITIAGGGDTIALLNKCGISHDSLSYCSNGGGAFLEWIEGRKFKSLDGLKNIDNIV